MDTNNSATCTSVTAGLAAAALALAALQISARRRLLKANDAEDRAREYTVSGEMPLLGRAEARRADN